MQMQPPTRPPAVDKSGERVQGMFAQIAPRYDLVNRILSGGIDIWWRRVAVKRAPPPTTGAMLDVCTGTGDLALAYAAHCQAGVRVVAADFCQPMLNCGIEKSKRIGTPPHGKGVAVEWIAADAMDLPRSNI